MAREERSLSAKMQKLLEKPLRRPVPQPPLVRASVGPARIRLRPDELDEARKERLKKLFNQKGELMDEALQHPSVLNYGLKIDRTIAGDAWTPYGTALGYALAEQRLAQGLSKHAVITGKGGERIVFARAGPSNILIVANIKGREAAERLAGLIQRAHRTREGTNIEIHLVTHRGREFR